MSRTRLMLTVAILGLAAPGAPAAGDATETARIIAIEQALAAAPTIARLAPYYDPNVVLDDQFPGRVIGAKAVLADFAAQFARARNLRDTIVTLDVVADDHLAFAYSIQHVTLTTATGQELAETFRQTDGYHRVGGKWLILYQNVSAPFDPKTGKAVFNEAP